VWINVENVDKQVGITSFLSLGKKVRTMTFFSCSSSESMDEIEILNCHILDWHITTSQHSEIGCRTGFSPYYEEVVRNVIEEGETTWHPSAEALADACRRLLDRKELSRFQGYSLEIVCEESSWRLCLRLPAQDYFDIEMGKCTTLDQKRLLLHSASLYATKIRELVVGRIEDYQIGQFPNDAYFEEPVKCAKPWSHCQNNSFYPCGFNASEHYSHFCREFIARSSGPPRTCNLPYFSDRLLFTQDCFLSQGIVRKFDVLRRAQHIRELLLMPSCSLESSPSSFDATKLNMDNPDADQVSLRPSSPYSSPGVRSRSSSTATESPRRSSTAADAPPAISLHSNYDMACSMSFWRTAIKVIQRLCEEAGTSPTNLLENPGLAFNFGAWESGTSKDGSLESCHGHMHILLTKTSIETLSNIKRYAPLKLGTCVVRRSDYVKRDVDVLLSSGIAVHRELLIMRKADEHRALVDSRLTTVEDRLTTVEDRLTAVDDRLTAVDDRLTAVEDRLTAVEGRLTAVEGRLTAVEGRLDKIENLLRQIVAHLGISVHDQ
jgi:hypothetical protein